MSNILTNKHVIVAMIVAPILAVIAYFGVDHAVSEKPHSAIKGESYPLVAKSNCRYESGQCTLENGDISISLTPSLVGTTTIKFQLLSQQPLQGVKIGFAGAGESSPVSMQSNNDEQTEWLIHVKQSDVSNSQLMLALSMNDTVYYGQTGTDFIRYNTGFSQNNINQ